MSSEGKTVTVPSTPENWVTNLLSNQDKACFLRESKTTMETDVPISEIVVVATQLDVN